MKRRTYLLAVTLLITILPTATTGSPFYYLPNTMIEDRIYDNFSIILEEGYWFLVFDNTGHITGNEVRNDSYVIYTFDFEEEGINDISGQKPVKAGGYAFFAFNFDVRGIFVSVIHFEMTASERISAFLTNTDGLAQYFDETADNTIIQRNQELTILIASTTSIIALLLVAIVIMRYKLIWRIKKKYKSYKNRKTGRKFKTIG